MTASGIFRRPHTHFHRRTASDASEPPEARGVARDAVKLLVARPGGVNHAHFADLGDYLRARATCWW